MKKLGFGLMRLPIKDKHVDIEATNEMVDEFISRGFTYFDTALMYCDGESESVVKKCIVERHPRETFTVTTKMPDYPINCLEDRDKVFNGQLEKTGCTYFDYYWLHDVNTHSIVKFDKYDCFSWLVEKKKQGLVKHIGFSFHDSADMLDDLLTKHPEVEYVQLQINYLDWLTQGVQSKKCYDVCVKHNKKVLVMEPVKGGTLAKVPSSIEKIFKDREPSMSIPSWAIRFAASLDNVCMVLSGMSNMEQLIDNTTFMDDFKPLSEEEFNLCVKAGQIINEDIAIACTGCNYCAVKCPIAMPISTYFSLYNSEMKELDEDEWNRTWTSSAQYYRNFSEKNPKASDCLKCGACEEICPQHLTIRDYLEKVAKHFEKGKK